MSDEMDPTVRAEDPPPADGEVAKDRWFLYRRPTTRTMRGPDVLDPTGPICIKANLEKRIALGAQMHGVLFPLVPAPGVKCGWAGVLFDGNDLVAVDCLHSTQERDDFVALVDSYDFPLVFARQQDQIKSPCPPADRIPDVGVKIPPETVQTIVDARDKLLARLGVAK